MDNNIVLYELEDCPHCRGVGQLIHEGGWCCYVECLDCGAQTTFVDYDDAGSKEGAEQAVVNLWNYGKVIRIERGEYDGGRHARRSGACLRIRVF